MDGPAEYCNLGLLQLLKKASRQKGSAVMTPSAPLAQQPLSHGFPGQDLYPLGRAYSALQYYAGQCPFCCYSVTILQNFVA